MIQPTVGRVVWFYKYVEGQGHKGPLAAIVCDVQNIGTINVTMFTQSGVPTPRIAVRLLQEGDEAPAADYCCWMPYQIGQAAKAEQLQKELAK